MDAKEEIEKKENPRKYANCLSALTFTWLLRTFWIGYKRDLELFDLPKPLKEHKSSNLGDKLSKAWNDQLGNYNFNNKDKIEGKKKPSLTKALVKVFGLETALYGIILAIMEIPIGVIQPMAVGELIRYFSNAPEHSKISINRAYASAGIIIFCSALRLFAIHPYLMATTHVGMKIRVACCSLAYRKSLKLSRTALGEQSIGQAVNLLSNDVSRFDNGVIFLHYLWIGPLQTMIVTYFMFREVGWSAIIGIGALLMFIPLQGWLGKRSSILRLETAIRTDERVRLTNEIINGIQAIKMYTWERPFSALMEKARKIEISVIRSMSYLRGISMSFIMLTTRLALFITILSIIFLRKSDENSNQDGITVQIVFMLAAYYTVLRTPMTVFFPLGIVLTAEAVVSIRRLQNFMLYEEISTEKSIETFENNSHQDNKNVEKTEDKKVDNSVENKDGGIVLEGVYAKWLKNGTDDTLTNINMKVKPGQLVAIVGQVGSGKSSLLNVILRELETYNGSVDVHGVTAYASQEPWLFAGSVRTNILFGKKMDEKRYEQVVKVCQLKRDFRLFPYGDKTLVGERGVSLSGGQRARINLARAVYADSPIYLFDDPLSAVDAHVGKHMFEECIERYLKGKTRILVTHQVQFLDNVEKIIVLKDGAIQAEGSYKELIAQGVDFGRLLETPAEEDDSTISPSISAANSRHSSIASKRSLKISTTIENEPEEIAELRTKGKIGAKTYLAYFKAGGNCLIFSVMFLCIATQIFISGGDYFINDWVNVEESNSSGIYLQVFVRILIPADWCKYIYTIIMACTTVVTLVRSFAYYAACMKASRRLHDRMFGSISRATMRFFNTNTSGRILNRFSKDMGSIDELLPMALFDCIQIGLQLLGIIIVVAITKPILLIPTCIIGIIFYYLRIFYLPTSRSVKRLEGISRSPVYNHLSATLQGLATIRSFKASKILTEEFDNHQDLHSSAWYIFITSSTAFGLWLDIFAVLYIGIVTMSYLIFPGNDTLTNGGNAGLAITQVIGITGMFQWAMRQSAELENQMTSVERVCEYTNLESEPPLESLPEKKPKQDWPAHGKIEFKNVYLSYGPDEAPVLKNLSFTINEREKIGIVGRTGAGKSSLISALFRFANLKGKIEIDGVETGEIGLHDLRSKISIIPQEPFLFSGTLRENLDPFESFGDDVLWAALEDVELKDMGLTAHVNDGGSNLSVGERQLVCLARAIVRNNKILILDEATANVDSGTDELIQKTIRQKFANCTVLTIAHRLNTVMDSDKILVVDAGSVLEFDQPHLLLQNPDGALSSMIKETGKNMADSLIAIAKETYELRQQSSTTHL
ncbi:hypothetical protein HCN44_001596 [Aphidius gifuensis]|uniref:Uncharacterized protein n=1 Tax=Aphidius gifuensis TaxID=684658 RepID=A0A834XU61_APHGI|nr:probable multidrug resistance-associated protein lethal(2)03659 [Aphidius gifuensis]KAF7992271.1 hypothetical protein HCN44_001596 [Aphidius gifuensis]